MRLRARLVALGVLSAILFGVGAPGPSALSLSPATSPPAPTSTMSFPSSEDLQAAVCELHANLPPDALGIIEPLELLHGDCFRGPGSPTCLHFIQTTGDSLTICWHNRRPSAGYTEDGALYVMREEAQLPSHVDVGKARNDPNARRFLETGPEAAALHGVLLRWNRSVFAQEPLKRWPKEPPAGLEYETVILQCFNQVLDRMNTRFPARICADLPEPWLTGYIQELIQSLDARVPEPTTLAVLQLGLLEARAQLALPVLGNLSLGDTEGKLVVAARWAVARIERSLDTGDSE